MIRKALVKILARDVGFRDAMIEHFTASKPSIYKQNMVHAFNDSLGRGYFRFKDIMHMPNPMVEKLQELEMQLHAKIPGRDLDAWANAFEAELNDEKRKDKATRAAYWLGVLKERRSVLFDPTILMEIAAFVYVREDEDPFTFNPEIHKEKFDMLWADSKEGKLLHDFFIAGGLSSYLPSDGVTGQNWNQYLEGVMEKIQTFNTRLTQISTYVSGLEPTESKM